MKLESLCKMGLAIVWLTLVVSYVAAPCKLMEESGYTMALFACQNLDRLPPELPSLSLVFCLVLCLVLIPGTVLTVSALRWNVMLNSVGITTLVACLLKAVLLKLMEPRSMLRQGLVFSGIVTGRAAAMYLGMMLLAISRRSLVSDWHGLDYPNMIAFHRPVGWWVVAMSLLHSFAFAFYYLEKGGWLELWEACFPVAVRCDFPEDQDCWNTLGLVNGFGVVATAAAIILGIFSHQFVRRRFYNLFYFTHLAASYVFMLFCGLHDFPMVILMFPGLVLYVRDRFTKSRNKNTEVTANILCQNGASCLLLSWDAASSASHLLPGTRWVYLRETRISGLQWHPYSAIFHGRRAYILLKAVGDWSMSLCNLARSGTLRLGIEGPYGKPSGSTWARAQFAEPGDQEDRTLLLLAGGVGISPFIDLLAGLPQIKRASWRTIKLVWAVRGEEYGGIASAIDFHFLRQRAEIQIFITSQEVAEAGISANGGKIGSAWDVETAAEGSKRRSDALIMLSFAVVVAGATASDFVAHSWNTRGRVYANNFMEWALFLRLVPLLIAATAVLLIAITLLLIPRFARWCCSCQADVDSHVFGGERQGREGLARGENSAGPLIIQRSKLDLHSLVAQEAQLGPVELKACGPERMLSALSSVARLLNSKGHNVLLENLEAEL